jgi:hypothetical protein
MILSFRRPSSQPIVWDSQPFVWTRELHLERGTLHFHIVIHSLGTLFQSVMEDFLKDTRGKDFSKMKTQYVLFVDVVVSKQVCVSVCMTLHYTYLCQSQLITLCVQNRFDDEVKDDTHGVSPRK